MKADMYFREFDETNIMHLVHTVSFKGAVCQAIQVIKPYKCDNDITWVYAITGITILTFLRPATVAWKPKTLNLTAQSMFEK